MTSTDGFELLHWLPRLRRYARALTGSAEAADDLVQDTLERAWSRSSLWPQVADMRAWLFSLMHNLYVDGVRRRRDHIVSTMDELPDAAIPAAQGDRIAVAEMDVALAMLPAEQREVLLLVALEDMPYAEVAQTLGVPIGTVMSRLSRGRERLRALMEKRSEPATRLKVVSK